MLLSPVPGQVPPYQITAYDACGGLPDELIDGLGKRLGPQITLSDGRAGLLSKGLSLPDHPEEAGGIAAAAVAMTRVGTQKPLVDFLNPRVGAKKAVSHKRVLVWGAGVAGACLIGLAVLLVFWHVYTKEITASDEWLKANKDQIAAAQQIVDRDKFAAPWITRQPRFLECLKELTTAFPEEPRIWASSLALDENGKGTVVGKTTSETTFYEVLDKVKQDKAFPVVEMMYLRDAGRESRDREFAIKFTFGGVK